MTAPGLAVHRTTKIATFHPLLYNDKPTGEFLNRIFGHLAVTDSRGEVVPGPLVEGWDRLVDGYRFTLKAALWHDGRPVTAADVRFTFDAVLDPDLNSPKAPEVRAIGPGVHAEVVADDVVDIKFGPGGAGLRSLAWLPILPEHYYGPPGRLCRPDLPPLGSGAYRFVEGTPDGPCTIEADARSGETASISTVNWLWHATAHQALAATTAGAPAIFTNAPPRILSGLHPHRPAHAAGPLRVHRSRDGTTFYLALNAAAGRLAWPAVRRAIRDRLDTRQVIQASIDGYGSPASWLIPPDSPWAPADPASRTSGADSTRATTELRGLHLRIATVAGDSVKLAVARNVATQLTAAGAQTRLDAMAMPELLKRVTGGSYDLAVLAICSSPAPTFLRAFFHSWQPRGGQNRFGLRDREIDAGIDALPSMDAEAGAIPAVHDLLHKIERQAVAVPLFHPDVLDVTSGPVVMPPLDGSFGSRFTDMHRWRLANPTAA